MSRRGSSSEPGMPSRHGSPKTGRLPKIGQVYPLPFMGYTTEDVFHSRPPSLATAWQRLAKPGSPARSRS